MNVVRNLSRVFLLVAIVSCCMRAAADTLVLYATDRGWYSNTGEHDPGNINYFVGNAPDGIFVSRNWFSFSMPPHTPEILDAKVVLTITHNISFPPGWSVEYSCWDFTGSMQDLWNSRNGLAVYQDLGSGTKFGQASLILGAAGGDIIFASGPAFLSFVKTAGTNFAIGGALTFSGGPNYAYLFGGSDTDPWTSPKLVLETVPSSPPIITCPPPLNLECTNNGAQASIKVRVADPVGNPLVVVWLVDGATVQTNHIPAGREITAADVTLSSNFAIGTHLVTVSVSNGNAPPADCSTSVTVHDSKPPEVLQIAASPDLLWPPNHTLRTVQILSQASDTCGAVTQRIVSVTANEPLALDDWRIVSDSLVELRASRRGGRAYSIILEFADSNGNTASRTVTVSVPHDRR